ncbi:putative Poly(3-hydroxybutyrate) depolymerase [Candidatus Sulfotelmatobacter kueseliae]|uniref:Putative Poly(3-hydroxybutyrate) depolymerase n=1 Tax=Candidatus Sulfotelmatobacter kueseliae TaxID=2042962 RepID=A0A2U3KSC6_9BACT|nr:putative Poly(3-hydroxybutyrate) depolymerase [Candidatus Sulfotelmatobacter kueseliae]
MKSGRLQGTRLASAAAGCVVLLFVAPRLWAQETKEKVTVDDVDRTFMVRLPKGYDPQQHYPVMILLHGMNQDADDIERLTQFDQLADKDGVIAVYPLALHGRWNVGVHPQERSPMGMGPGGHRRYGGGGYPGGGGGGGGYPGGGGGGGYPGGGQQSPSREPSEERGPAPADDVGFVNQMLDQLASKFSVDTSRIYAAGLSEGGFMSLRLGCALSDRIAAIAAVGAAMPKTMICLPSRPVPLVMINGTSDPVVPYGGGTEHNLSLSTLSVENSAKAWAKIDRCAEKPEHSKLPAPAKGGMEIKVDTYTGCQQNAQVVIYSVKGAGNTWPGGEQYEAENTVGKTSQDLHANEIMWNFLVSRKLPDKGAAAP